MSYVFTCARFVRRDVMCYHMSPCVIAFVEQRLSIITSISLSLSLAEEYEGTPSCAYDRAFTRGASK